MLLTNSLGALEDRGIPVSQLLNMKKNQIDIIEMSAGVIPLIRAACPSEVGRTMASFCLVSERSPAILLYSNPSGMSCCCLHSSCRFCSNCRAAYPSYLKSVSISSQTAVGAKETMPGGRFLMLKSGLLNNCEIGMPPSFVPVAICRA